MFALYQIAFSFPGVFCKGGGHAFLRAVFALVVPLSGFQRITTDDTVFCSHDISQKGTPLRLGALAEGTPLAPLGGMKKAPQRIVFPQQLHYSTE
jgi:hypothetical protein